MAHHRPPPRPSHSSCSHPSSPAPYSRMPSPLPSSAPRGSRDSRGIRHGVLVGRIIIVALLLTSPAGSALAAASATAAEAGGILITRRSPPPPRNAAEALARRAEADAAQNGQGASGGGGTFYTKYGDRPLVGRQRVNDDDDGGEGLGLLGDDDDVLEDDDDGDEEVEIRGLVYRTPLDPEKLHLYDRKMDYAKLEQTREGLDPDEAPNADRRPNLVYSTARTLSSDLFASLVELLPPSRGRLVMRQHRNGGDDLKPLCTAAASEEEGGAGGTTETTTTLDRATRCRVPYSVQNGKYEFELSVEFLSYDLDMSDEDRMKAQTPHEQTGWTYPVTGADVVVRVVLLTGVGEGTATLRRLVARCNKVFSVNRPLYEITAMGMEDVEGEKVEEKDEDEDAAIAEEELEDDEGGGGGDGEGVTCVVDGATMDGEESGACAA